MPAYNTYEAVAATVKLLNTRLFNAGYSFKVQLVDSYCVYVQASFDFGYYVNLHLEFLHPVFTNLTENDRWPDAWHQDQLFLYEANELSTIVKWYDLDWQFNITEEQEKYLFAFMFNITGKEFNNKGLIVCKELNVRWEHPYKD